MAKVLNIDISEKTKEKSETFINNIKSDMYFKSELTSGSMSFDWVDEIEAACPYMDNIFKNPKLVLVNEEDVVKIERATKVSVASIKDLAKRTHYIEKIDEKTDEVQPSKILIERREETYNTYENRFIYTLVDMLHRFILKQESLLEDFETKNNKVLEYAASTDTNSERLNLELKISSNELPKGKDGNDFQSEIESIKSRVTRIKNYLSGWRRTEFITSLEKANVYFVTPPIKKTNIILKNPNFQVAVKLWTFLYSYDDKNNDGSKDSLDTAGDNILKGILDDTFLMNYCVLDSISSSKREQKQKLVKYAVLMINRQIQRSISILLNSGIEITDEEILEMVSLEIKNERNKTTVGSTDVKNKFKDAMDEYLEKTKDYL